MWVNEKTLGTFFLHTDIRYEMWKEGKEAPGIITNEFLEANGYPTLTKIIPDFDPLRQDVRPLTPIKNADGKWELPHEVFELDPALVANNLNIKEVQRVADIKGRLQALDIKSVRALREGDQARIDALEAEAAALRAQL